MTSLADLNGIKTRIIEHLLYILSDDTILDLLKSEASADDKYDITVCRR